VSDAQAVERPEWARDLPDWVPADRVLDPNAPFDELRCPLCGGSDLRDRDDGTGLVDCRFGSCRAELYRPVDPYGHLTAPVCAVCGPGTTFVLVQEVRLAADVAGIRIDDADDQDSQGVAIVKNSTQDQVDCLADWIECGKCGTRVSMDYWEWDD
jgi:hypothetical protein